MNNMANQNLINQNLINPLPLNNMQHAEFDNYLNMLMARIDRILLRSILLTMIDHSIIYDTLNNQERLQANNIRNGAMNHILDQNSQWLVDSILNLVEHATVEQRIYIFNRIAALFHHA